MITTILEFIIHIIGYFIIYETYDSYRAKNKYDDINLVLIVVILLISISNYIVETFPGNPIALLIGLVIISIPCHINRKNEIKKIILFIDVEFWYQTILLLLALLVITFKIK